MTYDISEYNEKKCPDIKTCETCKCLTCESGNMFNKTPCKNGKNCGSCDKKTPVENCQYFKCGF